MSLLINGSEGTGSVADRTVETSKKETTGGVGARVNQSPIYSENELKCDTVCFRGKEEKKKSHTGAVIFGTLLAAGLAVGGLGLLHKNAGKISSEKMKKFVDKLDCVTKPCYKACSWVKRNCYDKLVKVFKKN